MEDTEWNDFLRAYGILPPKVQEKEPIDLPNEIHKPHIDQSKSSDDSELDDLDDPVIKQYSERRLRELQAYAAAAKYGEIRMIEYKEWITEVTEASYYTSVLVFLYKDTIIASQRLGEKLKEIAMKYLYIKIVKIEGNKTIEGYPDKNLPTLLVYKSGNVIGQKIIKIENIKEVEKWLIELNVLNNEEIEE
ncbi:hypothetical protein T552_00842 [Pneumocystis carinii B80]|uniref:Phosducin domain-containing protein n=1 Tax=Pneumocystis carinii (strain B80) TaxID=1408658 RepID=A0A0W4ZPT8_PNEC8|nr:hypothetical protein T552_00842 [Pneumocystis carinii B80]KTW30369.1 hypothetical protein T552_00842 [Pneumocystis carinii B80]